MAKSGERRGVVVVVVMLALPLLLVLLLSADRRVLIASDAQLIRLVTRRGLIWCHRSQKLTPTAGIMDPWF
ncbi:hypothetical protein ZWY2020_049872 [Hordeum vulgare]|nr:hypothetical protein ZWY2020_049872 [Hordeum vulgare]